MQEKEFTRTLLFNLALLDIIQINVTELGKKLYSYYLDPKYKGCFNNILLSDDGSVVDLTRGISTELKEGYITFKDNDTIITHYNKDSLKSINISAEDCDLIMQMAKELNLRHFFESEGINIYGVDPNQTYMIGSIKGYSTTLITDGSAKILKEEIIFRRPLSKLSTIEVSEASYVGLAGKFLHIYTKILDYEKLKRIRELTLTEEKGLEQKENLIRVRKL